MSDVIQLNLELCVISTYQKDGKLVTICYVDDVGHVVLVGDNIVLLSDDSERIKDWVMDNLGL